MTAREEQLLDRIAELEEILGLTANVPVIVRLRERGLKRTAARLLGLLIKREFVPYSIINDALFGDRPVEEVPGEWSVRSAIKEVRAAAKSLGVEIKTSYGEGFSLSKEQRTKLLAAWPELDERSNVVRLPTRNRRTPREVPFQ